MKKEEFDHIINESINEIDEHIDFKSDIMKKIENKKPDKSKYIIKRTLILVAVLISFSTVIFAGVQTLLLIELKNSEDEVISVVEVVETEENPHLDSHVSMEDLIRYGDSLHGNSVWDNKSFIVIDSLSDYPYNMDIRPISNNYFDYSELSVIDDLYLLPQNMSNYIFQSAAMHYDAERFDQEEVERLIKENDGERFIVTEVETGEVHSISYRYKNSETDLSMSIYIDIRDMDNTFQVFSSMYENYEVIQISDIDVFLIESDYIGVTYKPNKTVKTVGENHYHTIWYEPERKIKINIKPELSTWGTGVEEEIDGEIITVEVYPENTREEVIMMSELIHDLLNE